MGTIIQGPTQRGKKQTRTNLHSHGPQRMLQMLTAMSIGPSLSNPICDRAVN